MTELQIQNEALASTSTSTNATWVSELNINDIIMAVMGHPGAGKSTFIDIATEGNGRGLQSNPHKVTVNRYHHPDKTNDFVFVEIPGFDYVCSDDTNTLQVIADWLEQNYRRHIFLSGIIFRHRISDNVITNISAKNQDMLINICGRDALRDARIVSTIWKEVTEATRSRHQKNLADSWHGLIECESQIRHFDDSYASAWEIIKGLGLVRRLLQIQAEIVEMGYNAQLTTAGKADLMWLEDFMMQVKSTIPQLKQQLCSTAENSRLFEETQEELTIAEEKFAIAHIL